MSVTSLNAGASGTNNGFQPVTSGTLDEFSIVNDTDGVITRTVAVPAGNYAVMSTLGATLTIGAYSYTLTANTVSRINVPTAVSSYTFSCTAIQPGFQWRNNPGAFSLTNTAYTTDRNYLSQKTTIAFGGSSNLFVIIPGSATGGTVAYTTADGITFTSRTLPSSLQFVTYAGSYFYAFASTNGGGTAMASSPDGITWTARAFSVAITPPNIVKGSGTNYATIDMNYPANTVGLNRTQTSTDGLTWSAGGTLPSLATWSGIASDGTTAKMVVVAAADVDPTAATTTTKAAYSTNNGTAWTATTMPSTATWANLKYVPSASLYFASSASSVNYATSPDGITWTARTFPDTATGDAFSTGQATWIGNNGVSSALYGTTTSNTTLVYYTTDCINFTVSSAAKNSTYANTTAPRNIAYGNNIHLGGAFYVGTTATTQPAVSTKAIASFGIYSPPTTQV